MSDKNLAGKFTFWIFNNQKKQQENKQQGQNRTATEAFNQNLSPIITFQTTPQFWSIFQYMKKPSNFDDETDVYLFREGIVPQWEDSHQDKGGYFTIKIQKDKGNKIWENMVFAFIAPVKSVLFCVNGIRMKAKEDMVTMQIWMNATAQDYMTQLKQYLKDCLQITDEKIFMFFFFDYHLKKVKGKEALIKDRERQRDRQRGGRQKKGGSFYAKKR